MEEIDQIENFDVTLTGPGVSIKKTVDRQCALAVISLLLGGVPATVQGISTHAAAASDVLDNKLPTHRVSLREFLEEAGAKNIVAMILCIGAYLRDHEDKKEFSRDDVAPRFKAAGQAAPSNLARDFQTAISKGWIAEDSQQKGLFYITRKGDEAILARFDGERSSSSRKKRKIKTRGQRDTVDTSED